MELKFTPLIENLQRKVISIALQAEEPRVAVQLEGDKVFFIDTERGQILLPKTQEEKDGGGQLDEVREGDVSEELQGETAVDGQGEEDFQGPSGEI
jgi:hypothetical protein